jgi:hypothetical protein
MSHGLYNVLKRGEKKMPNLNIVPWHLLRPDLAADPQNAIRFFIRDLQLGYSIYTKLVHTIIHWMKSQLDEKDEYIQKCEADLEALGEYKAQIFEVIPGGKPIDIEKLQAKVEWLENELEGREEQLRAIQESVKEAIDPT